MTAIAPSESQTLAIAGRTYRSATPRSWQQQLFYNRHYALAGLSQLDLDWKEDPAGSLKTIGRALMIAGSEGAYLLAACLVEEGRAWSEAGAEATAAHFLGVSDEADVLALTRAMEELLLSFFPAPGLPGPGPGPTSGAASSETSPSSSDPVPSPDAPIGAPPTSETGTSSASSPTTIPTG